MNVLKFELMVINIYYAVPDVVTDHALITWLSCTDHAADHAQIT